MSLDNLSITVASGPHDRANCPVRFTLPESIQNGTWQLRCEEGSIRALQQIEGSDFVFIEQDLPAGTSRVYHIETAPLIDTPAATVKEENLEGDLHLNLNGKTVTRYHYRTVPARPYFYPLLSPAGCAVTRAYPMETEEPGETHDHPHHRSVWIAFGELNGTDNWSEEPGHGYTQHQSLNLCESGPVFARFNTTSLWTNSDRHPLLTQYLDVILWATDETVYLLDFNVRLEATHGAVHFGDTKEGGILSVRVASALDVPRGGRIENVYGGINEAETWGKAAHWCDYSGLVADQHVGLAILDHPLSFRSPSHWHVRNYGLMTANPFGYAAYTNGVKEGSHLLPAGQSLDFRYRMALHQGNAAMGQVNRRYLDFAHPPAVKIA